VIRSTFNRYRGKKPESELKAPNPRSRGFGFVEVANAAQRDEAVSKASGTLIASREIGVKVAKEMQRIDGVEGEGEVEKPTQDVSQIQGTPEKA
jgi:RNA recognition motif-containing protein